MDHLTDRLQDPELRLQHARDLAWRALNRADRTQAEIRRLLEAKRVAPAEIDLVVSELSEQGYLDDASYAQRFAEDQRRLSDWGPDRIERKLRSLGVASEHIEQALAARTAAEELDAAVRVLARRVGEVPQTARERDRALGMLLRKGFALELAYDALRRFANAPLVD